MPGRSEGLKLSLLEAINTRFSSAFRNLKSLQIREKANLLYNASRGRSWAFSTIVAHRRPKRSIEASGVFSIMVLKVCASIIGSSFINLTLDNSLY